MPKDVEELSAASVGSKPLTFGSLFAGIGGFDLGLERAGMRCEWQVEIDPYARAVLAKHWPDVRRHEDVRTFPPKEGEWGVDVICGGFPCQDISVAGKGAGLAGARSGLWYEYARIIGELRPRYVIVENVAALLTRGMGTVLGDLSTLGYDAEWHVIRASDVGAPHRRERIWVVAYAASERHTRRAHAECTSTKGECERRLRREPCRHSEDVAYTDEPGLEGRDGPTDVELHGGPRQVRPTREGRVQGWDGSGLWLTEPDVGRVAHGVPARVDRLRCLGNAVVPQIVEVIGRAIVEAA